MFISALLSPYDELFNIKQNFKMKKYMPLNGLRWSRDSGSTLYDTPQTVVLGQPGGVRKLESGVSPVVRLQSYIRLTIVKIISHYSENHFPL